MSAGCAIPSLASAVESLERKTAELSVACADVPEDDGVLLAERIAETVDDLAATAKRMASRLAPDAIDPREAVAAVHAAHIEMVRLYQDDLAGFDTAIELWRLGRRREEWSGWAGVVAKHVSEYRLPLQAVGEVLLECWRQVGPGPEITAAHGAGRPT